jgi:PAS domain S-box-containing protein
MNRQAIIEKDIKAIQFAVLLYIVLASIWILLSDAFLMWLVSDVATYYRLQTYKGWFFVAVTASILYLYLKPRTESLRSSQKALFETKEQLRESEEKYRTLVNGMNDTVWVTDFKGRISDVNDAATRTLGYTRDEMLSMTLEDFDGTLATEELKSQVGRIPEERNQVFETTLITKDGMTVPVEIKSSLVKYNGKESVLSIARDITERRIAEEELRRRLDYELATVECMRFLLEPQEMDVIIPKIMERIHYTVDNSRTYIFQNETDPDLGLCMSQIYEIVGEGVTEQIDNPLLKHLPYSEGSTTLLEVLQSRQHYAHLVEQLDEPDRTILGEQGILSILILPIFSGQELWGFIGFDDCVKARLWHEDDIKLLRVVADGIGEAIHRKEAETALMESEERFKALHNASFGGIAIHDKGIILDCNQGLAELSGYGIEELIGMNGLLLMAERCREVVLKNILSDYEEPYEATGLRKDGTEYPVRIEARNIPYKGKQVRVTEFRDITEQKQAEISLIEAKMMAEESNRIKSEFLANMSHELRTPLTAVIGFSDILSMQKFGELNSKQLEFTGHILNSGKHLLELINDILDLSKIEAGKMELYCEDFSVDTLLEEVQRTVYPLAARKNIELTIKNDVLQPEMFADRFKFKQIMYNLLSNAIKFTPDDGKISVFAKRDGNFLEVSVSDTGIGISADRLDEIFDPFMQVDASNRRKYGGTGLGLALVKRFVEMHGGKVRVKSEEGKGSTFIFTLAEQKPALH